MDTDTILRAIHSGDLDADLGALEAAIDNRKRFNAERVILSVKAGDRVTISPNVRPTMLAGREVTVVRTMHTRKGYSLVVDLDHQIGRWHKGITLSSGLIGGKVDGA